MKYLEPILMSVFAVFAPIRAVVLTVFLLCIVDLGTGIAAAKKRGEPITSSGIKNTVGKLFLYEVALCLAFLVQQYLTGEIFPACKIMSALIGLVELKSVLENLDTLHGSSLFASVLTKITQSEIKKDE